MKHLNGNVFCAIDTETTGLDPFENEIVEIAAVILNPYTLDPVDTCIPFNLILKPENVKTIDPQAMRVAGMTHDVIEKDKIIQKKEPLLNVMEHGVDRYMAAEMFVEWFNAMGLADRKKLIPVAHNWVFDSIFIRRWLGNKTFELLFSPLYRDTLPISLFENDIRGYRGDEYLFQKNNLSYLCSTMHIERDRAHRALDDAIATAKVFKTILTHGYPRQVNVVPDEDQKII